MISELETRFMFFEPTSKTFGEAVGLVRGSERAERARHDNRALASEEILSWRIAAQSIELLLSSARVLRIFCKGDVVDWVFDREFLLSEEPRVYAEEVRLRLENDRLVVWRPAAVLASLRSVRGLALSPTTTLVTLGIRGGGEILFAQMADQLGRRMLFFEEE